MITVLNGGTRTTIQDAGRPSHRHQGIPSSGAADRLSFAIANYLVGNDWQAPSLECTLGGLHIRFTQNTTIAVSGAQMWGQINGQNIAYNRALDVEAGDILTLSYARAGCRAYIAVAGGLDGDTFLGSVSTYLPAALGGIEGRALKTGDMIMGAGKTPNNGQILPKDFAPILSNHVILRTHSGPEWDWLSLEAKRYLFTTPFYATQATSRMGCRLKGDRLTLDTEQAMTSAPLLEGTLQVPPNGEPILMGADAHCTGGYARALHVIKADHWLIGQIAPGMAVSFRRCFAENAPKILKGRQALYNSFIPDFQF